MKDLEWNGLQKNRYYQKEMVMKIKNLEQYPIVREHNWNEEELIGFENKIVESWEVGKIRGPIHLSNGNETQLIEIFKRINTTDWVFSTWRSHYHALLKGISPKWIENEILDGKSITLCNHSENFYSSAIVGGTLSIALGVAMGIKRNGGDEKVWCFIGDMSFESGLFYETHKYARNFDLPLYFIVEDNGVSTYTPTEETWKVKRNIPDDVIYYQYNSKYPHYGTGKWVVF
jgi:TPP-dependent pyruvate/acetoin dehydrogenase alpha subunit